MANTYDKGDLVRITGAFTVAGTATDPTTVTLKILRPAGTSALTYTYAAAEITKDSVGNYHKDITIDTEGEWYYRWIGTGTVVSESEDYFFVRDAVVT